MEQLGKLMLVAPEASQEISEISARRSKSLESRNRPADSPALSWFVNRLLVYQQQRGLPAKSSSENRLIASSWLEALKDVPSEHLDEVFSRAVQEYADVDDPFGVQQLRAAWNQLRAELISAMLKADTQEVINEFRTMAECAHEYDFHPRAEDDPLLIKGYHICRNCDRAVPVMEKTSKTAKQIAYLQAAAVKVNVA